MYFDESTIVYHNGKWIPAQEATVALYSQTLHYGMGVFEGIRAYNVNGKSRIFRGEDHYRRLSYSARSIGIPFDVRPEELIQVTYELLERNGLIEAYVRPLVYSSPMMSLSFPEEAGISICVWPWKKLLGDKLINVCFSPISRPHPKSCRIESKASGHYINSILAATEARAAGYDDALQLDVEGNVAECSGANFFIEKDGVLITPPTGHILPGITRDTILQMSRQTGIQVNTRKIKPEEVFEADSAFCVGTAAEVCGIGSVDGKVFSKPWKETLGFQLQQQYDATTRRTDKWENLKLENLPIA